MSEKTFETKSYSVGTVVSSHGRSYVWANCPFCQAAIRLYLWSLRGSGKKCACGAILYQKSVEGYFAKKEIR